MEDVEIAAGAGHDVRMSGADVLISSERATRVEARSIELTTGWNGDISVDPVGGAFATGQMQISGSRIVSTDPASGMRLSSNNDIELMPGVGRDVVVSSGGLVVSTSGSTSISSRSISTARLVSRIRTTPRLRLSRTIA